MKKWGWIWVMIVLAASNESRGQKKWDGEANDSLWNNPKNWYPDGLPNSADSVVIDNSILQKDIFIWLYDSVPIVINALTIIPQAPFHILLEIPKSNTQVPAISVLSKGNSISIHSNATLTNESGAPSGNTIILSGKFWIGNDGKYIHRTLRGNANLIAALSVSAMNYKGIFEFDVPGSAGYTISISGRQFGTLQLSSTRAPKKTYNGSGSSNLVLWGDLNIGDSVTLNATLNGNIGIHGNLSVLGKCILSPSLLDTVSGRQLQFWGDTSTTMIKGSLLLSDNFRNIVIEKGETKLLTSLLLSKNSQSMIIRKGATLDIQEFQVGGPGKFKTESNASLKLSGTLAIDSLNSKSSIFIKSLEFDPATAIFFHGDSVQYTGIHFPSTIGKLTINKQTESVYLSKKLEITDTLLLKAGNVKSSKINQIIFRGKYIEGHDSAYVDGPLTVHMNENKNFNIPIGDSSSYAPILIYRNSNDSSSFQLEYRNVKSIYNDSSKLYPLIGIVDQGYWSVEKLDTLASSTPMDSLVFYIGHLRPDSIKGQPAIARFDSTQNKWIGIPSAPMYSNGRFLKIVPQYVNSGVYSLGELQIDALSKTEIQLQRKSKNENLYLEWIVSDESQFTYYILQRSRDGMAFTKIDSIRSTKQSKAITHSSNPIHDSTEKYFYRIKGNQVDGKFLFSNVVFVSPLVHSMKLFPNPTQKRVTLQGMVEKIKSIHVIQSEKASIQSIEWNQRAEKIEMDVSLLTSGVYALVVETERGIYYRARFIKIN